MEHTPEVIVGPPDALGRRKVLIRGKLVGKARSPNELQRLLDRAGLTFEDVQEWVGGSSNVWPDHAGIRRITGIAMAAGLLGTACVLIAIGAKDAADALTFAGRMAGFILLAAGVGELLCMAATVDYWGWRKKAQVSGSFLLIGVSVALFVGVGLLVMHVLNGAYPWWHVLIAIAVTAWALWAEWVLRREWKGLRHPRRIAAGAVVSILLVVANLAYGLVYVPSAAFPVVQSSAEFGMPSLDNDKEKNKLYVRVRLHIKNVGQVPVYVLGSIYWINAKPSQVKGAEYDVKASGEVVAPPGRVLNPAEEYSEDVVAEIANPGGVPYETVRAETETYVIRKDRLTMTADYEKSGKWRQALEKEGKENDPPGPDDRRYKRYQSEISQSSELLTWVRGRERVTVWWVYRNGDPHLYVNVSQPGESKVFETDTRDAADRYGLAFVRGSVAEAPLAELMKRAQARPVMTPSDPGAS
ncbi:hypothetical protein [Streptomyces sp. NPDC004050]